MVMEALASSCTCGDVILIPAGLISIELPPTVNVIFCAAEIALLPADASSL